VSEPTLPAEQDPKTLASVQNALRLVCAALPHLSGLARAVRVRIDRRVATAGIFASGRLLVNPEFFAELDRAGATFVMAHELLHLALRSHERSTGSDPHRFNCAHDYIINDMLVHDLGGSVPAGGLVLEGARHMSVEKVLTLFRDNPELVPPQGWSRGGGTSGPPAATTELGRILQDALRKAGIDMPAEQPGSGDWPPGDVLDEDVERQWFPDSGTAEERREAQKIRALAARADSLGVWLGKINEAYGQPQAGGGPGGSTNLVTALRGCYRPPWEEALQRWMDAVAPGPRSYARPSRRGADRTDVVLAGRKREGWTLHVILDTSGSMTDEIPRALGAIADFCEGAGVDQVHLLQCDTDVSRDELVTPEELARYAISGYGGSDMSPAMLRLADDLEVEAAIVLTDGCITYPDAPMPYQVLWVLPSSTDPASFTPPYGNVIGLTP
jgi:predicted metal-dependent peptidase